MLEVLDMCRFLKMDFGRYFGDYLPAGAEKVFKGNY